MGRGGAEWNFLFSIQPRARLAPPHPSFWSKHFGHSGTNVTHPVGCSDCGQRSGRIFFPFYLSRQCTENFVSEHRVLSAPHQPFNFYRKKTTENPRF